MANSHQSQSYELNRFSHMTSSLNFMFTQINIDLKKRTKIGIFVFIVFYIFLYLHVTARLLLLNTPPGEAFTFTDTITFIVSGTAETVSVPTTKLPVYISAVATGCLVILIIFILFLADRYISYIVTLFSHSLFIVLPCLIIFIVNSFIKTYRTLNITKEMTFPLTFLIILHIALLTIIALCLKRFSEAPFVVIHPFIANGTKAEFVLITYIIFVLHFTSYVVSGSKIMNYLSLISSFFMTIYLTVEPVYIKRWENAVLLTISIYNTGASLMLILKTFYKTTALCMIFAAIFVSVLIYYIVYPFFIAKYSKRNIVEINRFIGNKKKVCELLETIKHAKKMFSYLQLRTLVIAAIEMDTETLYYLKEFEKKCQRKNRIAMLWIIHSEIQQRSNAIPELNWQLQKQEFVNVCDLEKEFWFCAWLSDQEALIRTAGKIARAKANYNNLLEFNKKQYPGVDIKGEPFKLPPTANKIRLWRFQSFNIFIFIVFTMLHIIYYLSVTTVDVSAQDTRSIQKLINEVCRFHISIWDETTLNKTILNSIDSALNELKEKSEESSSLKEFIYGGTVSVDESISYLINNATSTGHVDINNVYQLTESLNYSLTFLTSNYKDETYQQAKEYRDGASITSIVVFATATILIIIVAYKFRGGILNKFKYFRHIPKEIFVNLGEFTPRYDIQSYLPYRGNGNGTFSFKAINLFLIGCEAIVVTVMIILELHREDINISVNKYDRLFSSYVQLAKIELYTTNGVIDHKAKHIFPNAFFKADNLLDNLYHNSYTWYYFDAVPKNLITILGNTYINPEANPDYNNFADTMNELILNVDNVTLEYVLFRPMNVSKLCSFLIAMIIIYTMITAIVSIASDFITFEALEPDSLLNTCMAANDRDDVDEEFSEKYNEEDNVKEYINEDCGLSFFIVNSDGTLSFHTQECKSILGIDNGDKIRDSTLQPSIKNSLLDAMKTFKDQYREDIVIIPTGDSTPSLIISPHYFFDGEDMLFEYIYALFVKEPSGELRKVERELSHLKDVCYPPFVKEFPMVYPSKGRNTIIGIVRMVGFNEWCDKTDIKVVTEFRKSVSAIASEQVKDTNGAAFCRLYEEGEFLITTVNRDADVTLWNMHVMGAALHSEIVSKGKSLVESYNNNIIFINLLYKCKELQIVSSLSRMSVSAPIHGAQFICAERLSGCISKGTNYTVEKSESRLQNTTHIKKSITKRGVTYDIFLIV